LTNNVLNRYNAERLANNLEPLAASPLWINHTGGMFLNQGYDPHLLDPISHAFWATRPNNATLNVNSATFTLSSTNNKSKFND